METSASQSSEGFAFDLAKPDRSYAASIARCDHPDLECGDRCPQCDKGRVYDSPPKFRLPDLDP